MSRWRAFRQGTDCGVSDWCLGGVRFDRVRTVGSLIGVSVTCVSTGYGLWGL